MIRRFALWLFTVGILFVGYSIVFTHLYPTFVLWASVLSAIGIDEFSRY